MTKSEKTVWGIFALVVLCWLLRTIFDHLATKSE